MKNVVIFSYASFNWRRYSRAWLCRMTERGGYDFNANVGTYTGAERGEAGDLVVFEPEEGVVYGYGQKDYRGIRDIESLEILSNDPFRKFGTPMKIAKLFGGKSGYLQAVHELQTEIYVA